MANKSERTGSAKVGDFYLDGCATLASRQYRCYCCAHSSICERVNNSAVNYIVRVIQFLMMLNSTNGFALDSIVNLEASKPRSLEAGQRDGDHVWRWCYSWVPASRRINPNAIRSFITKKVSLSGYCRLPSSSSIVRRFPSCSIR